MTFDSKREAERYLFLRSEQLAGRISDLKCQVSFTLLPPKGKERAVKYIADFTYIRDGKLVVEDVKSKATKTPEYIIKRKLMLWHGYEVQEV